MLASHPKPDGYLESGSREEFDYGRAIAMDAEQSWEPSRAVDENTTTDTHNAGDGGSTGGYDFPLDPRLADPNFKIGEDDDELYRAN